jgi:hypothetical protein
MRRLVAPPARSMAGPCADTGGTAYPLAGGRTRGLHQWNGHDLSNRRGRHQSNLTRSLTLNCRALNAYQPRRSRQGAILEWTAGGHHQGAACGHSPYYPSPIPISKAEADLLEIMRADRVVQNQRQARQAAIDAEANREHIPAVRIERVIPRRPSTVTREPHHGQHHASEDQTTSDSPEPDPATP